MAASDSDIRAAIEARARKARPHGQVTDDRAPLRETDRPASGYRARRFVIVEEEEAEA